MIHCTRKNERGLGKQVHEDIQEILFTEEEISQRIQELGQSITNDYVNAIAAGESLALVCVLRGAAIFMADLARAIDLPVEMDYLAVSSYGNETKSSGIVQLQKDLSSSIEGKHVVLVEDLIDSGLTLSFLRKNLASRKPASLEAATLLWKNVGKGCPRDIKYRGFECPDEFIVGYGLDYAQQYRNLPYIGTLKPQVYTK